MVAPLLIAAAGAQAAGSILGGIGAKKESKYNAKVGRRNAAIARDQAAAEMLRQNVVARKTLGAMRAAYGAAGVTVEGSPLDVLEESAATAELDRLTIQYRGELRASGAEIGAKADEYKGDQALLAGFTSGAGSILSMFGKPR